ncbi:hypothetical protein KPL47_18845 [Clostridium estertheticum]|uniref:hypothetical protein n=1 Tax=Clostridium estertheticum TaxID=238834 RepID=UPI001C0D59E8|nr:hypothetical protein [Clostridium estertheticum]MBU3178386.1 hypothetical protein [Clostridium estertheticum]
MVGEISKSDVGKDITNNSKREISDNAKEKYDNFMNNDLSKSEKIELKPKGGGFKELDNLENTERHHMPSCEASNLTRDVGPAIIMDKVDHMKTGSWGRSREAKEYRNTQKEFIDEGKFKEAQQMDINDVKSKFGNKYDDSIREMKQYSSQYYA